MLLASLSPLLFCATSPQIRLEVLWSRGRSAERREGGLCVGDAQQARQFHWGEELTPRGFPARPSELPSQEVHYTWYAASNLYYKSDAPTRRRQLLLWDYQGS
jgi:hypothetical protein